MNGKEGSKVLTFCNEFVADNEGNTLNKWLSGPFIKTLQIELNNIVALDVKREKEKDEKIKELEDKIKELGGSVDKEGKVIPMDKTKEDSVAESTQAEVMETINKDKGESKKK